MRSQNQSLRSMQSLSETLWLLSDKIAKPKRTQSVKFAAPLKGRTTSLNQNDEFVYQNPSFGSCIKGRLYIRHDTVILDKKGEWYKMPQNKHRVKVLMDIFIKTA